MPAAAKYQKARLRQPDALGRETWIAVLPSQVEDTPTRGDLICIACLVPMKRVRSYSKMKTGTEVPAYLSLYPNTHHAAGCPLNVDKFQSDLRRSSPDTVSIEDKVLYLHLPDEERLRTRQRHQDSRPPRRMSGDRWTSTMHTAMVIARFLRQFDERGDILKRVKITYRDHSGGISEMFWSDFCFRARSPEALRYLRRLERASATGHAAPPVAVIFPVEKEAKVGKNSRFLRVDTFQTRTPGNECHKLQLSVAETLAPDHRLLADLRHGPIVVLAHGRILTWTVDKNEVPEVRLEIAANWQIPSVIPPITVPALRAVRNASPCASQTAGR